MGFSLKDPDPEDICRVRKGQQLLLFEEDSFSLEIHLDLCSVGGGAGAFEVVVDHEAAGAEVVKQDEVLEEKKVLELVVVFSVGKGKLSLGLFHPIDSSDMHCQLLVHFR